MPHLAAASALLCFTAQDFNATTAPHARQLQNMARMASMTSTTPTGETYHMRPTTPPKTGPAEPASTFDSLNVVLKHHVPIETCCSGAYGSDIWGYTSAATGKEWALMCYSTGMSAVDVQTGDVVTAPGFTSPLSPWKDIKVFGHHAYYVTEALDQPGIVVFDLSGLDSDPPSISDVGPAAIDNGGGPESSHNVVVDEVSGYLYRVGGWDKKKNVRMYDLNANPAAPEYIGKFGKGFIHDAQVITFASGPYAGKQVMFACKAVTGSHGLQIWDLTDKSAISLLGFDTWPGASYSHNVWVDVVTMRAYVGDEGIVYSQGTNSTLFEFDVSDLSSPSYVTSFTNGVGANSHNHIILGGRLYAANYASGMRVFDLSSRSEVGYFDTYPDGNGATFNGAWGAYVFPASRLVVVSDMNRGLFILEDEGSLVPSPSPGPSPSPSPSPGEDWLEACKKNGKRCIELPKAQFEFNEPIEVGWKGASKDSFKVAITKEDKLPEKRKVRLFLHTPVKSSRGIQFDGDAAEGGKKDFPLAPGTYDAHLANKGKSKSGGLTFTITGGAQGAAETEPALGRNRKLLFK